MPKKVKIKIIEGNACAPMPPEYKNAHSDEEARMHRTALAHLIADAKVLLDLVSDEDDLPEWLETKITKAGDYMSSAARYIAGNVARVQGQLEENINVTPDVISQLMSNLNVSDLDQESLNNLYTFLSGLPKN